MKQLLLITILTVFSYLTYAQTAVLRGNIIDEQNGEPLIGANVILKGTNYGAIADVEGDFKIPNVPEGNYMLQITYIGYNSFQKEIEIEGGDINLGVINMNQDVVGLKEVKVFADIVTDRKTPIAISTIDAKELDERFSGMEISEVVQNTPGVYSIQGAGGYGDNEVYIRGLDQTNVAFLVNGIPVNDMENGRMYWSNFAGLSEVSRQTQVQRGLGASKLAINAIGGSVNMITKPADKKRGGRLEQQIGTGSWNQRTRFSYNTGENSNGWAFSFQGSRTTSNSSLIGLSAQQQGTQIPGAFVDAWSYYVSVSKKINEQHQIMFWGFGAPVNRGTAFVMDEETRATFGITDPNVNNILGTYQGELFNVRQNKINKPLTAITHYWDMDAKSTLTTSLYYSYANVYSVQPRDANESLFFPERTQQMVDDGLLTPENLINWDNLASMNRASSQFRSINNPNGNMDVPLLEGYASRFYSEARYNNHNWLGLISNYKRQIGKLSLLGGIDLRRYRGSHFARVHDTFGGDFVLNESPRFADDYNKLQPNGVAKKGDKFNYDYDGVVNWAAAFGQAEYRFNQFTAFVSLTGTNSNYTRYGYFWNGRPAFEANSLGKSATLNFLTYTAKTGVSYTPDNRHKIFANAGHFIRPPFFGDVFADARYGNVITNNYKLETVNSAEIGYGLNTSKIKVNVNAYYTTWNDRNVPFNVVGGQGDANLEGLDPGDFVPLNLSGIESTYKGIELDFSYNPIPTFEVSGFASIGDWKYTNGSSVSIATQLPGESEMDTASVSVDLAGFPVGAVAQTTAGLGFHYTGIKSTYIGMRSNYSDNISVRFAPADVARGFITADQINSKFDDFVTFDLYAGRYFDIGDKMSGRLSVNVQNLFDTEYIRWSSYFTNQFQNAYGFGRTFTIGLSITY